MSRRYLAVFSVLGLIALLAGALLFSHRASASPQELTVKSQTKGYEALKAYLVDNEVRIRLQIITKRR